MKSGKYRLQLQSKFNSTLDNLSLKLWSRHNAGGDTANRYGGMGISFEHGKVGCKEEPYHNVHVSIGSKTLSKKIPDGKLTGLRFDCELQMPAKKFIVEAFIAYDATTYEKVAEWTYTSKASGVNDKVEELYCWVRTNGPTLDLDLTKEEYIKLA